MIDCDFVEDQETVVRGIERNNLHGRILFIVFFKIETELLCNTFTIDFRRYAFLSLLENRQYGIVYIIVDQHNRGLRLADKL